MAASDVVWLLCTGIFSMLLGVAYALAFLRGGSRSTPPPKARASQPPTQDFEEVSDLRRRVESLEVDQASLSSTLEKLTTTTKRLTSRAGMRELREKSSQSGNAPPIGTSKAELRRHYGLAGKTHSEIAQMALHGMDTERPN